MADVDFKGASLSRIVPAHRKTLQLTWLHRTFMLFGTFKAARKKMRMDVYENCHWCKKPFADPDMMTLAGRPKGGNVLLCQSCAEQASQSDRRTEHG